MSLMALEPECPAGSNNLPLSRRRAAPEHRAAYHRRVLPAPALLAVGLVLGLLVLLPARRLQLAGLQARTIGLYAIVLWGLGFFLAVRPGATRFMIPILLIAYVAPFVVAPDRMARILRRGGRLPPKPPAKNVTPPNDGADEGVGGGSAGSP